MADMKSVATGHLNIPVEVPPPPFSPWLRLGIIDCTANTASNLMTRYCDDFYLHLQMEGESWIWLEALNACIDIRPHDLIFIPPGFVHCWQYNCETHLGLHFDLHAQPQVVEYAANHLTTARIYRRSSTRMPIFHLHSSGDPPNRHLRIPMVTRLTNVGEWIERLGFLVQVYQTHTNYTLDAQSVIGETIFWALRTLHMLDGSAVGTDIHVDPRIDALLGDMRDPRTRVSLEQMSTKALAERTGMSVTVFYKQFHQATGMAPGRYMCERRIERAAHMLVATDTRIRDIALTSGFEDQYYFSRVFAKLKGISPRQYRYKNRR